MTETIMHYSDMLQTLERIFGGKTVSVAFTANKAIISTDVKPPKKLKARGLCNDAANINMIPGEKGVWEGVAVEKHAKTSDS